MTDAERQRILDEEHLRLLRIGYFVAGGTTAAFSLLGFIYVAMGIFMAVGFSMAPHHSSDGPPAFIAWLFAAIGVAFVVTGGTLSALKFLTARAIGLRRSRTLCLVTAALTCLSVPYGTALGIFTFVVLGRPSVSGLFGQASAPPVNQPPLPTVVTETGPPGPVA